jgi:hypothetical protein
VDGAAANEGKGRPTPKRRDTVGVRGPVTAPKTRKEAYARQRQQAKATRQATKRTPASSTMTVAERRVALRNGDMLSKRDQGVTRKIARDYVDSRRLISNYLLLLFPLLILGPLIPGLGVLQVITLALFIIVIGEWFVIGRRIRNMSMERHGEAQGSNFMIGFYAGSRAYLPRRWRMPAAQVRRGDEI